MWWHSKSLTISPWIVGALFCSLSLQLWESSHHVSLMSTVPYFSICTGAPSCSCLLPILCPCTSAGLSFPTPLFGGRSPNSPMATLRHFHGFEHINNPGASAAAGISIPYLHWDSRTRAHHPMIRKPKNVLVIPGLGQVLSCWIFLVHPHHSLQLEG